MKYTENAFYQYSTDHLAYLGINALRSKGGIAAKLQAEKHSSLGEAARDGAMISLLNPKLALFFYRAF